MIIHVFTQYQPKDPQTVLRNNVAHSTWTHQPWVEFPVKDEQLPRHWDEEGRSLPFIKDIFDLACQHRKPQDIIVYTNADICVRSDCAVRIAMTLQTDTDACYGFRRDFNHDFHKPMADSDIEKGDDYCGSDIYGFRVKWWLNHRNDMPDLIAGLESWDACLRHLIDLTNPGHPHALKNLIYHRRHASWWERQENRYRLKGQLYCLDVARKWLSSRGIDPKIHGIPHAN